MSDTAHTHDLESAKQTLMVGASPRRYICEVQREIYDFIENNITDHEKRDKGLNLVAEAFWAGKRMSDRLKELKAGWDADDWPENPDYEADIYRRAARLQLLQHIKSVNIGTIDWCNRKCEWCPNAKRNTSELDKMPADVFKRILRQLKDYNYTGEIHPFLNGEPTMDPRLPEMIAGIKGFMPECRVKVITNGDGIRDRESVEELISSGVDSIHINHYDGPLSKIGKARDSDYPQITHSGLKALLPTFYNRAGKVDRTPDGKFTEKGSCSWFLHKLVFNHRGDMVLCCSDWDYKVVFGNIVSDPLASILNSKLYRKYYYAHKEGKGKALPLCRECNRLL